MKSLVSHIIECFGAEAGGIAQSIGDMEAGGKVTFATPGNTMGMGNPKLPTPGEPGSEIFGASKKMKPTFPAKKKKKTLKEKLEEGLLSESRGVVTGINSWDKVVDFICYQKRTEVVEPEYLAPWMDSVKLIQKESRTAEKYYAAYQNNLSTLKNGKLRVVIEVDLKNTIFLSKEFMLTLQHEFTHAFDDWLARSRGLESFFTDKYKKTTGGEFEETSPYNVLNPTTANCDDIFALLKWCTYFFEPTEVNAYSREFDKWLDTQTVIDLDQLVQSPHDDTGINPLTFINLVTFVLNNESKYIIDADHMDWDYISQIITKPDQIKFNGKSWSQLYIGKNMNGKSGEEIFRKTLTEIYKIGIKNVFIKYRKIIENHMMDSGLKVAKFPSWWIK